MPLPGPKTAWLPATEVTGDLSAWAARWAGLPEGIGMLDGTDVPIGTQTGDRDPSRWNMFARRSRQGLSPADQRSRQRPVHDHLAGEIPQVSADLLFGQFPDLLIEPNDRNGLSVTQADAAQDALELITDESGMADDLLAAAEICAALGGVYLRVTWDPALLDVPFVTFWQPQRVHGTFRQRRLTAATLTTRLDNPVGPDGKTRSGVWRHLEVHGDQIIDPATGALTHIILNGLYVGDERGLGTECPLDEHPATATVEPVVYLPADMGMVVHYVPNVRPYRRSPGSPYGRADISGSEGLLDALDRARAGLDRDVDLGQSRIFVPQEALEQNGAGLMGGAGARGAGRSFNLDESVTTLQVDPADKAAQVTHVMPTIRATEHGLSAVQVMERVVSIAGYAPQTFGLHIDGRADTATALNVRKERTDRTIARKRRYWATEIVAVCRQLLVAYAEWFDGETARLVVPVAPALAWPEPDTDPAVNAATALALSQAGAASLKRRVEVAQPGLRDEEVDAEVAAILAERAATAPLVPAPAAVPVLAAPSDTPGLYGSQIDGEPAAGSAT